MKHARTLSLAAIGAAAVVLAACAKQGAGSGDSTAAVPNGPNGPNAAVPNAAAGPQTPDAGGRIVAVTVTTDPQGTNKFDPAEVSAKQGDVVRYTLGQGVHNVHFLPDSNPGKAGLPPASDMLQLPGQTYDVKVTFAPGTYYFQCDPHALLGMKGHLTVAAK
jgi:plastocyanin